LQIFMARLFLLESFELAYYTCRIILIFEKPHVER
jgi:hypothetical protein